MNLHILLAHIETLLGLIPSDVPAAASVGIQLPAGLHTSIAEAHAAVVAETPAPEHIELPPAEEHPETPLA